MKIKNYLKGLVEITTGPQQEYYKWVLRYGREYKVRQRGAKFQFKPRMKECYRNSVLAHLERGYPYCDGYVVFDNNIPIAIEHAFNLINERVIDTTADEFEFKSVEYFGIIIPDDILEESMNHLYLTPLQLMFRRYLKLKNKSIEKNLKLKK